MLATQTAITMANTKDTAPVEQLLKDGKVTLTADSRENIYKQSDELVAAIPDGTQWTRTPVEYDGKSTFAQTYIIIKEK